MLNPALRIVSIVVALVAAGCAGLDMPSHSSPSSIVAQSRAIDLQLGGQ